MAAELLRCENTDCAEYGVDKDPGGITREQMDAWGMTPMCGTCGQPCAWVPAAEPKGSKRR